MATKTKKQDNRGRHGRGGRKKLQDSERYQSIGVTFIMYPPEIEKAGGKEGFRSKIRELSAKYIESLKK